MAAIVMRTRPIMRSRPNTGTITVPRRSMDTRTGRFGA